MSEYYPVIMCVRDESNGKFMCCAQTILDCTGELRPVRGPYTLFLDPASRRTWIFSSTQYCKYLAKAAEACWKAVW